MVRINHASGASVGAAGCASSSHTLNLRSATERARAKDDARRTQMGLMLKSKLGSRFSNNGTRRYPTVSTPTSELLNGLPVRVREEVEMIRPCCLACITRTRYSSDGDTESDTNNLHRHQLFSEDHVSNLDPEIRQWLPRIVCPAFPFSVWCQGGGQLKDAMFRHIEACEGFKAYFPGEYRKLFSRPTHPRPPFDEEYQLLKMTYGQLEFLRNQFREMGKVGQHKLPNVSTDMVEAVLRSWRPIVRPGVEEVLPSDFPPVRVPSFFGPADHGSMALDYGMPINSDEGLDVAPLSSSVVSENMEDAPELVYPELYLPPQLLGPTSDPAYVAAAVAAHKPRMEEYSPLVHVPFPSVLEEIPRSCFEEAAPMNEHDWTRFLLGRDVNGHTEGFHIQLQETAAHNDEGFDRVFA